MTGLDEVLLRVATESARLVLAEQGSQGWLDVRAAAEYLSWTPDGVRAAVKRRQVPFHKTPQGRLLFSRRELDEYVRGEAA